MITNTSAIPRLGVPAYHWRNNILHGLVDNGLSTQFPQAIGLAATWDVDLLRGAANIMGIEQRAKHNIAVNFSAVTNDCPMNYGLDLWGPNINLFRDPRWGRGQETYGEDPTLTGTLAAAFIQGIQQGSDDNFMQAVATAKHFAAYSLDRSPPRLSFDPTISEAALRQMYFKAWKFAIDAGVGSIMCSYNGINGDPMCMSPYLQSILRNEYGFDGYLVTDTGALQFMVTEFQRFDRYADAASAALNAGVDLNSGTVYLDLNVSLAEGAVTEEQINTALSRLLQARIQVGLFDPPYRYPSLSRLNNSDVMNSAHLSAALTAAEASLVLLRNQDGVLPLTIVPGMKVAVIGPAANDPYRMLGNYYGCSNGSWGAVDPACVIQTPLFGIQEVFGSRGAQVAYAKGCDQESQSTAGIASAVALASASDVTIVVVGLRNCEGGQGKGGANCESEGHDRPSLNLPGVQLKLIQSLYAVDENLIVVFLNGGPISEPWVAQNAKVVLEAWYGGSMGGTAIANALVGTFSPSGRLPFTVVHDISQVPLDTEMEPNAQPYGRGYSFFTETPLWAFGFGLSYATFSYNWLTIVKAAPSNWSACVTVTQTSSYSGRDVVQVYASLNIDPNDRFINGSLTPLKTLVNFQKTNELLPNQSQRVCLEISDRSLYLMSPSGVFGLRSGTYTISVGGRAPGSAGLYVGVPHPDAGHPAEPLVATLVVP
eukprot:c20614_g1_i1.p1 GENE.c20614_g1_i1~~c20614_g1_i1.p1  ORF type:complete len:760 (+),score=123.48 c20614_g1_i1:148-2280(+)